MRILLVEDDETLGDGLFRGLKQFDYIVDWVKDGQVASEALQNETFDMVILDLGLPKKSGIEVLKEFRARQINTPVLILTAHDSVEDRVEGLDSGADDFLPKPFNLDELAARIRALQRRHAARAELRIEYGSLVLDPAGHSITLDGQPVSLPRREFALLHKLLENQGQVLSREALMQSLYGWGEVIDSNVLEVHIHNLRKKLNIDFIRTIRGVGYMIDKIK